MGDSRSKILALTALGAPTRMHDCILSLALLTACHNLEAHEISNGSVANMAFLADSKLVEEESMEEAIKALASELDKKTCKRLLRISDCPWLELLFAPIPEAEEKEDELEGRELTLAAPESSIKQKWYIMVSASIWVIT